MHAAFDCLLPPGVARITLWVHGWGGVHGSNYTTGVNKPDTKEWLCQRKGQRQRVLRSAELGPLVLLCVRIMEVSVFQELPVSMVKCA